jgi:hypothetical protein
MDALVGLRDENLMKTLVFVIALFIVAIGGVGLVFPSALIWLAHSSISPAKLYAIAAARVAFGLLLLTVAGTSRFPRTLRIVAFLPILAGLATPFVGVDRAPALVEWWTQFGHGIVRVTALLIFALGGFFAYACAPVRRAV